jgi:hypothetical protein
LNSTDITINQSQFITPPVVVLNSNPQALANTTFLAAPSQPASSLNTVDIPAASVITVTPALVPPQSQSGGAQPTPMHGGSSAAPTPQPAAATISNVATTPASNLVYKPNTGIWVGIGKLSWSIDGAVNFTGPLAEGKNSSVYTNLNNWKITTALTPATSSTLIGTPWNGIPTWTSNTQNIFNPQSIMIIASINLTINLFLIESTRKAPMNTPNCRNRPTSHSLALLALILVGGPLSVTLVSGLGSRSFSKTLTSTPDSKLIRESPLSAELVLPKDTFAPLEPIVATIKIRNTGIDTLFLEPVVSNYQIFDFEVEDRNRTVPKQVPRTEYYHHEVENCPRLLKNVKEEPGASFETDLIVNLVCDMTSTNNYSIVLVVSYWKTRERNPKEKLIARSAPVKVKVAGPVLLKR